jgi:hypothetical protein
MCSGECVCVCVMCSCKCVFLRPSCFFLCVFTLIFLVAPLWILRFSWGLWFGVVVTLCSFLFTFCAVFVYCGLFRSYFSFVLGFVA